MVTNPAAASKDLQDAMLTASEGIAYAIQASLVAVQFWRRLNLPEMAVLECRRAIRQYGVHAPSEELAQLVSQLAR
jgi:hypothetical protein